uniref:Zinc finger LSD1-type domain-containing protein n=1 Tax=Oryza nivara TaxID=4536 RepID=A0A0E0HJH2_ORYNI
MPVPLALYPTPVPFAPPNGAQSQLVCSGCCNLLMYPAGAMSVCCTVRSTVTAVPAPDMHIIHSGIRNSTRVAMIVPAVRPLAKYTLELCVSTPPPVAAAAMECVLDEYATKHRISIDRFLQLRIFVKVHDRFNASRIFLYMYSCSMKMLSFGVPCKEKAEYECNRLPAMIDAHLFRDYHLAFWFGLFCAWGQPQDGDLHLWLPHQCRCHLGGASGLP